MRRATQMLSVLVLAALIAGCGGETKKTPENAGDGGPKGEIGGASAQAKAYESPEAVFKAFNQAAAKKDFKAMFDYVTPESQNSLVGLPLLAAGFATFGDEDKQSSLESLVKKHGLDPDNLQGPEGEKQFEKIGSDQKAALFADLVAWLDKNMPEGQPGFSEELAKSDKMTLSDVSITGETAAGKSKDADGEVDDIFFKQIDGKWYVDFEKTLEEQFQLQPGPLPGDFQPDSDN